MILLTVLLVVAALLAAAPAGAGDAGTNLPNGAALEVSIDDPVTSTEYVVPDGSTTIDVDFEGTASVGLGEPDATIVFVMDGSGSTGNGGGTGCSPILNCEKQFFVGLSNEAFVGGSVDEAGVAVFGAGAKTADMKAAGGDQLLTDNAADVNTVVNSATASGGVTQFTAKSSGGGSTNFAAGINAAVTILGASTNTINIVVMASDGFSNSGGSGFSAALASLVGTGATAYTVAIGSGTSCSGGSAGTLQQIAGATGGACYQVPDPGNLPDIIPDLISTTLESLEIDVDGGGKTLIANTDIDPDLPHAGPVSVNYDTTVTGLGPGDHDVCVTANGSDPAGSGSITQCETIHVFGLDIAATNEINELGNDNEHTVTATLSGDHEIEGRTVTFQVTGQNPQAPEDVAVDTNGEAEFTYTVDIEPDSLGMDSIEACFTTEGGDTVCVTATKEWVDTTPPAAECLESVNPHGNKKPKAPGNGGQGQNQDGFYQLTAQDDVWPFDALELYVLDTGSGTAFGPYPVETVIKYTEDQTAIPEAKKMGSDKGKAGAVDYHIIGNGDAAVYAVDGSGNTSAEASCLVPPPPK